MRNEPAAIVQLAFDEILAAVRDAHAALRRAETTAEKARDKATESRGKAERHESVARRRDDEAAQHRLELGRALVEARKRWPARGPKAKGWGDFLESEGIEESTAWRYMQIAGYSTEVSCTGDGVQETSVPTYAEAGIDRRPRLVDIAATQPDHVVPAPTERAGGRGKPAWLMESFVRDYSDANDLVCDPMAGFASTLTAARTLGRRAIGAEIDNDTFNAAASPDLDLRFGDWRHVLDEVVVDAIITDPPYSQRTHDSSRKFGNARDDGSPLEGLGPSFSCWTQHDVMEFVKSWSDRCRGWIVALTDHHLIPAWERAYEAVGRYSFAPVVVGIRGMTVRLCGDGPSSWALYAMVSRPRTDAFSRWRTLPGMYVGTKDRQIDFGADL